MSIKFGEKNKKTRETWLEKTLASVPEGHRILDAGAGELQYKRFCGHLDYVAQDFAQYDGTGTGDGLQTGTWDNSKLDIISDITSIPEPNQSFDAIMCIEVFEHIPEPIEALREFSRLLKPDGLLIVTAPVCSLTHFAPYYFYNGFSRYFYETMMKRYGFQIKELTPNGNYFEYVGQEMRRVRKIAKQYSFINLYQKIMLNCISMIANRLMLSFAKKDRGSSELMCFGMHLLAVRNK